MPPTKSEPETAPDSSMATDPDPVDHGEALEPLDPASFNAAYEVLRRNAELLRDQEELDIDRLVPLVEQSMQAYRICRSRLDAVRLALESRLGPEEGAGPERSDQ